MKSWKCHQEAVLGFDCWFIKAVGSGTEGVYKLAQLSGVFPGKRVIHLIGVVCLSMLSTVGGQQCRIRVVHPSDIPEKMAKSEIIPSSDEWRCYKVIM